MRSGPRQLVIAAPLLRPALRYPVTLLFALQYVGLAVVPAVINNNPYLPFVLSIAAVGLLAAFLAEWIVGAAAGHLVDAQATRYPGMASVWVVTLIGGLALLGAVLLGAGTYATLVGLTTASPLTTLLTPLAPWLIIGCGFALASWRAGVLSRRSVIFLITVALASQVVSGLWVAKLAAVMSVALSVAAGMALAGFFRPRWLLVGFGVAIILWPTLYEARNAARGQIVASSVSQPSTLDASSRLREDLLLQQAALFGPLKLPQPSAIDIVRFGLIPRALDPGRGSLPGGTTLSVAVGSTSQSSSTFTVLGTLWSLNGGFPGVILYVGCVALAICIIARRLTPTRLALAMLLVNNLIWIEVTYPDNVAAALQGLISLAIAWLLTLAIGTVRRGEAPGTVPAIRGVGHA